MEMLIFCENKVASQMKMLANIMLFLKKGNGFVVNAYRTIKMEDNYCVGSALLSIQFPDGI